MKRLRGSLCAGLMICLSLPGGGCYSRYVITTTSGNKILTAGKPRRVDNNFVYRDASGEKVTISALRVRAYEPYSKKAYQTGLRTMPDLQ